jgi:hypothetical protein
VSAVFVEAQTLKILNCIQSIRKASYSLFSADNVHHAIYYHFFVSSKNLKLSCSQWLNACISQWAKLISISISHQFRAPKFYAAQYFTISVVYIFEITCHRMESWCLGLKCLKTTMVQYKKFINLFNTRIYMYCFIRCFWMKVAPSLLYCWYKALTTWQKVIY